MSGRDLERNMLRTLVKGSVGANSAERLEAIARELCHYLDVDIVIFGMITNKDSPEGPKINALTMIMDGEIVEDFEYFLKNTPCEIAIGGGYCCYEQDICQSFPRDIDLIKMKAEAYVGSQLFNAADEVVGVISAVSRNKIVEQKEWQTVVDLLTFRVSAEIHQLNADLELKKSEEKFRSLAENSQDHIMRYDKHCRHLYQNLAASHASGFNDEQVIGKTHRELGFDEKLCTLWEKRIGEVLTTKEPRHEIFEWQINNENVFIDWRLFPEFNTTGEVETVLAVCRDITESKQQEDRLRHSQKMESLGTLSAGIAHDFNNILHAILGFSKLAEQYCKEDNEFLSWCLDEINSAGERATALVNRIKTYGRFEKAQLCNTTLNPIIEESLSLLQASLPSNVTIETDLGSKDVVVADPTLLHQVVVNLCTNALHATEENGGLISITTNSVYLDKKRTTTSGVLEAGQYVELTVSDTGSGISAKDIRSIFDPFYTTKDIGKGSGLGLAIVHGNIAAMQGAIQLSSKIGEGSRFSVFIPQSDCTEVSTQKQKLEEKQTARHQEGTVLLIDDETSITTLAKMYLERLGFSVAAYNDPNTAFEAFQQHPTDYSVLVTDLSMPKMNGIELSKKIRQHNQEIPIIVFSGHSDINVDEIDEISTVLSKPLSMKDLAKTIISWT